MLWINAEAALPLQISIMERFIRPRKLLVAATQAQSDTATVPAAWPSGVSQLAQAVNACHRRNSGETGIDRLQRGPNSIVLPPAFFRA